MNGYSDFTEHNPPDKRRPVQFEAARKFEHFHPPGFRQLFGQPPCRRKSGERLFNQQAAFIWAGGLPLAQADHDHASGSSASGVSSASSGVAASAVVTMSGAGSSNACTSSALLPAANSSSRMR